MNSDEKRVPPRAAASNNLRARVLASVWVLGAALSAQAGCGESIGWKFDYDDKGYLTEATSPGGTVTQYRRSFDNHGRLRRITTIRPGGKPIVRDFDVDARLASMTDAPGDVRYDRDAFGRLTAILRGDWPTLRYEYDLHDRIKSLAIGEAMRVGYEYDYLGRLSAISTPGGRITYRYDAARGATVRRYPNGVESIYQSAIDGSLESIAHVAPDRRLLMRFEYAYRADGLIEAITETSASGRETTSFEYDTSQRLVASKSGTGARTEYTYDPLGNRVAVRSASGDAVSASYDWAGRLQALGDVDVAHDADLNVTRLADDAYAYRDGALVSARTSAGESSYAYDGDGLPVERTVDRQTWRIVVDPLSSGWNPLMVIKSGEASYFIWDGDLLLATVTGNDALFHLHDHLGTRRADVSDDGAMLAQYRYDTFGEPLQAAANFPSVGFAGMTYDPVAAAYITPGRFYNPALGRFLQPEPELRTPLGSQEDLSPYPYCANDPVNYVDREGYGRKRFERFAEAMKAWFDDPAAFTKKLEERTYLLYRLETADGKFLKWGHMKAREQRYKKLIKRGDVVMHIIDAGPAKVILRKENFLNKRGPGPFNLETHVQKSLTPEDRWRLADARYELLQNNRRAAEVLPRHLRDKYLRMGRPKAPSVSHRQLGTVRRAQGQWARSQAPRSGSAVSVAHVFESTLSGYFVAMPYLSDPNAFGNTGLTTTVPRILRAEGRVTGLQHSGVTTTMIAGTADLPGTKVSVRRADLTWLRASPSRTVRSDTLDIEGRGYRYQETMRLETPKPKNFVEALVRTGASALQMYNPLADYGPGDTVTTTRHLETRQSVVTRGGVRSTTSELMRGQSSSPAMFDSQDAITRFAGSAGLHPPLGPARSPHSPHEVGGVWFGGAGRSLDIGLVSAVYVEEATGRLMLIAEKGDFALPPLRVDDLVTVFRAVYDRGSPPWVSIDPKPEDPEGPTMNIVLSPGTENTFVGWVLFEADRIMKGYSLGRDNVTGIPINSAIDGYRNLLETGLFDAASRDRWERFWIVPASSERVSDAAESFANFEVPLEVNTEVMIVRNGRFVTAGVPGPNGTVVKAPPSARAGAFSRWFTQHMGAVGQEFRRPAPAGSGIDGEVDVFFELKRLALISAIAEKLRDDGIPMPHWMREYEVASVDFGVETPAIVVTEEKSRTHPENPGITQTWTRRLYGGARLAPPPEAVTKKINPELAAAIVEPLTDATRGHGLLDTVEFSEADRQFAAVMLPVGQASDVGGLSLRETDMVVAGERGSGLELARFYDSFSKPESGFGKGWVLGLPELSRWQQPVERTADETRFTPVYELRLAGRGTWAVFSRRAHVPEMDAELPVPRELASDVLALVPSVEPTVFLRDGRRLKFDAHGRLVSVLAASESIVYQRDDKGSIRAIESRMDGEMDARIELYYTDGRITSAWGSNGSVVAYDYAAAGRLQRVAGDFGVTTYSYSDDRIVRVDRGDGQPTELEYDGRSRLLRERQGNRTFAHQYVTDPSGKTIAVTSSCEGEQPCNPDTKKIARRSVFSSGMELVESEYASGTRASVASSPDGERAAEIRYADGGLLQVSTAADGAWTEYLIDRVARVRVESDAPGRPTRMAVDGQTLFEQQWHGDGRLAAIDFDDRIVRPEYKSGGAVTGLLLAAPANKDTVSEWTHAELDANGRPAVIRDATGLAVTFGWREDDPGELSFLETNRGARVETVRDEDGQLASIRTSWGAAREFEHAGPNRQLSKVVYRHGGEEAEIRIDEGRVTSVRQFDGGKYTLSFDESKLKEIKTPASLSLRYEYEDDRLDSVLVGSAYRSELEYDERGRVVAITRSAIK